MKSKVIYCLCMLGILFYITGCQNNDKVEDTKQQEVQVISETCEIIESSAAICEKAVESGIYTEYSQWEKAIEGTDVQVVLDRAENFDETFFEDKALIYLVECSSGGAQCKYEGYDIENEEGSIKLYVNVSGSTEHLLNKLHGYHVFFIMNKSEAEKLDRAEISFLMRD